MKKYAKKSLGQHFLVQQNVIRKIIEKSGISEKDTVIELGIGTGALTYELTKVANKVIGVEIDKELIEFLEEQGIPENLTILIQDMLTLDFEKLQKEEQLKLKIFGNLPYYLSTQMIFRLIRYRKHIDWALLMFQKEVAKRLTAKPGTKEYGIPTVILGYCADIETIMELSPKNFRPVPKVYSSVIKITFKEPAFKLSNESLFMDLVKRAFSKRRKTLENNLKGFRRLSKDNIKQILQNCNINPKTRAEELSCNQFVDIANQISMILNNN